MIINDLCNTSYFFVLICCTHKKVLYICIVIIKQSTMATEHMSLRIETDVLKYLKKLANNEKRTPSGLINKILSDYKQSNERKK